MDWKNLLYLMLAAILPIVYHVWLADTGIPLSEQQFVELVLWLIGLIVVGWNAAAVVYKLRIKKVTGKSYEQFVKSK